MIEGSATGKKASRLTYGMVGGGQGAFIGDVHRKAIAMDGKAELVAGCFSQDHQNTLATGEMLGLDKDRLYSTFEGMMEAEGKREDKIDFVVIVTPNNTHFAISKLAMENGIHVVCDKPLTTVSADAEKLERLSAKKDLLFCVTYTYTGYPVVKHLREMIAKGDLGVIRFINAEYPQEWLSTPLEKTGQKQAAWRTNPELTGASNCVGDIGSHIENMVSYLTGLKVQSLCARLDTFVEGRILDDNASILVDYAGGAKGLYWSSQIAVGHDNGLRVRVYGTKGSVEWCQEHPNYAKICYLDKPTEIISRGRDSMYPHAQSYSRVPAGHPEGYFEAFANIYSTFCKALGKKLAGESLTTEDMDYPGVGEGVQGVRFIERCVESSKKGAVWTDF
ncbi:MAG: Gfo/Idh/MocA family oxidoreductase [Candidatus Aminicenantes bacterium]|nr:Gfo/Idh/MocA family oxidoreductase [Candidatus Aminicenantes bacterium]MDH5742098.1 Gfo/Idh/MocA family oxidoreductase [Candidatus Aminicenantes bacterium]